MGTTNLFVELVVIGVGAMIWLLLFVLAFLGVPLPEVNETMVLASAIPLLALTYVAGIIWDRVVDYAFEKIWVNRKRKQYFAEKADYYNARRNILTKSERLADLHEYSRSRMRICRAWTFNSVLIAVAAIFFLSNDPPTDVELQPLVVLVSVVGAVFATGAWFSWSSLVDTEFRRISEQSDYLAGQL